MVTVAEALGVLSFSGRRCGVEKGDVVKLWRDQGGWGRAYWLDARRKDGKVRVAQGIEAIINRLKGE
jgi:hypothetical protein